MALLNKILRTVSKPTFNIYTKFSIKQFNHHPLLHRICRYTSTQISSGENLLSNNEMVDTLSKIHKDALKDLNERKVFAVVHIAGSQFKVAHNDVIMINKKIEAECGECIKLEKVLAVGGKNFTLLGQPLLKRDMVDVEAIVVEKTRGEKKIAFKMKKRKGYKKWKGHRQDLSVLKIQQINFNTSLL